jgi:hypothetical protein
MPEMIADAFIDICLDPNTTLDHVRISTQLVHTRLPFIETTGNFYSIIEELSTRQQ